MQPTPPDHRLYFTWFPNPEYLGCKTKPPFLQQKVNAIHNYPAKLLTLTDAASRQTGSGLPKDVFRGSGTPPGLGTEGTLELGEGRSGWLDRRVWAKAPFPGQRLLQGRSDAQKPSVTHPKKVGGLPHSTHVSHRAAVSASGWKGQ